MAALLRFAVSLALSSLLFAGAPAAAGASTWRPETPYALHSMVYLNSPSGFKRAMFAEAAASGASSIRLDMHLGTIYREGATAPDWTGVDEVMALSREFRIRVTAVVLGTPWWMARCHKPEPFERLDTCPPSNHDDYGRMIGDVTARTRGTIDTFEVLNEPDGRWAYTGTPADYAITLAHAHAAVKRANPRARVLIGGVMGTYSIPWLERVLRTPGAKDDFDIANVHVRGTLAQVKRQVRRWREFFAAHGIHRPIWVTEHGYPSDPAWQRDPQHTDGAPAQARYLVASMRAMRRAGAARVFVTQRDNLEGEFASEGILGGTVHDPPADAPRVERKPAFHAFARVAWRALRLARKNRPPSRSSRAVNRGARHTA